ncbi:hypothetical protein DXT96_06700 [Agrobacterium sp. ICMP 6402]|uniref:helix-turn-helix domain-containing protein n=1 Tax=Agrobacterium sp. ICMP 6402 TaxID=2292443 RepID=UPI001296F2C7|nr:helix-turn-helix domain-containing protein [Agrobacterium sp. ICMP 6402]MQB09543.1 hypothetical protein [Agrobacterium sp. ICMP 6402]
MNHHVTLTPSQRAWHEAAKAREADRVRKAMRLKSVAPAPKAIEMPKPRLVQVAPEGQIIPLHFTTFKSLCIAWVGEYCPYAGGSVEIARARRIVFPRQIIFHAIKTERPNLSFPQVGHWMGGRDHTTALHAVNKIQAMIDNGTFEAEMENWQALHSGKARAE